LSLLFASVYAFGDQRQLSIEKFQVLRSKTWGVNGKAVSPLWNILAKPKSNTICFANSVLSKIF